MPCRTPWLGLSSHGDDAKCFAEILQTYGLHQHVLVPTHESGHTLDLIITRSNNDIRVSTPKATMAPSDHNFIECNLDLPRPCLTINEIYYRKLRSIDIEAFKADISASLLCKSSWSNSAELASCYDSTLASLLDKHAPLQKKTMVVRSKVPWYTTTLRDLKSKRRKLERKMILTDRPEDRIAYYKMRDYYTNILHETKRLYYANLIDEAAGDTKKLFGIVNSLCKADNRSDVLPSHDSPRKLANEFGNFFIKKVDLIQEDIDNITVTPPEVDHRYPDTKFETFSSLTDEDVHRIVMSSSNSTCSLDPNPTWLIKRCSDVLTPIITQMINLSLSEGHVPAQWKNAVVRPLLKKSGLDPVLKNFRPVSNLAFVGKAAEKAVIEQLINHCTTHQLLPVNQSSYRKYHSTETALVKVHNDILTSMDNQEVTFLILLDLSAAFDTINHSLLMNIVENDFGITGLAKKWLASYLGNRQQRITIKGCFSDYFLVNSGVPQGSCLGPVLFLLYASGLFNVASRHRTNIHAYADDTQVYLSFKPSLQYDMAKNIEQCITDLRAWMVSNRLLINDSKTEFLVIGSKHQLAKINVDGIMVGNTVIKSVTSVRNLGAWFDQHMSMNDHVSKVCSKAFYSLYNLRQVRKYLSDDTSKILVHSLVTCHLDYCNALLHDIPQYQQQRLQKVLNAAARFVYQLPKFCHITPVLKALHWLPVKYRIMFKIILLVFKILHGLAPTYLQDLIKVKPPSRYQLRSDDKFFLVVPKTKCKTFGDRAFYKAGPDLWNHLPLSLRNTNDLQKFKKDLKTHLFRVAFLEH